MAHRSPLVASADIRIRDRVHFVNALGPYFDAETLLVQATSRSVVYESERMPWDPDPLTLRVLTNELLETLENPRDAELLKRHVRDGNSLDPGYLAALSPQGRTVARLLNGRDAGGGESAGRHAAARLPRRLG